MLIRHLRHMQLPISLPPQPIRWIHRTRSNPSILNPLTNHQIHELDFPLEIICCRDSLNHRIDPRSDSVGAGAGARRRAHEVEERLHAVGEVLAVIESGGWDGAFFGEVPCCFEGEVVEVAPGTVGG